MAEKKSKRLTYKQIEHALKMMNLRVPQLIAERDEALKDRPVIADIQAAFDEMREQRDEAAGLAAEMTSRAEVAEGRADILKNGRDILIKRLREMTNLIYRMQGYIDHARERAKIENGIDPRSTAYVPTSEGNSQNPANKHQRPT